MEPFLASSLPHPHPCDFRLARVLDRGWGEMAFEYRWNSTSGLTDADGTGCPDIAHCFLYEITTYAGNDGTYAEGYFLPPDPPFVGWKFRDPTDGRTAPVALGCFPASQGWAWDRHKIGGPLHIPELSEAFSFRIAARQQYRFHCDLCGMDAVVPGSGAGLHNILRSFAPLDPRLQSIPLPDFDDSSQDSNDNRNTHFRWRYALHKHGYAAYLDIDANGYADDSVHIGFGPPDLR